MKPPLIHKFLTLLVALLGLSSALAADAELDLDAIKKRLPEKIAPLTSAQLEARVPQSYEFDYPYRPQPGSRAWKRIDAETWHEVYPDGSISVFKTLGHATVRDTEGTIVVKIFGEARKTDTSNDGGLQAFIPDKGSKLMHHWYRNTARGDTKWNDLAEMKNVK